MTGELPRPEIESPKIPLYEPVADPELGEHGPELITPTEYHKNIRAAAEERTAFAEAIRSLKEVVEVTRRPSLTYRRRVVRIPDTDFYLDPAEVIAMKIESDTHTVLLDYDTRETGEKTFHVLRLELSGGNQVSFGEDSYRAVKDYMENYWQRPPVL